MRQKRTDVLVGTPQSKLAGFAVSGMPGFSQEFIVVGLCVGRDDEIGTLA
jgi:hypothetical protein